MRLRSWLLAIFLVAAIAPGTVAFADSRNPNYRYERERAYQLELERQRRAEEARRRAEEFARAQERERQRRIYEQQQEIERHRRAMEARQREEQARQAAARQRAEQERRERAWQEQAARRTHQPPSSGGFRPAPDRSSPGGGGGYHSPGTPLNQVEAQREARRLYDSYGLYPQAHQAGRNEQNLRSFGGGDARDTSQPHHVPQQRPGAGRGYSYDSDYSTGGCNGPPCGRRGD